MEIVRQWRVDESAWHGGGRQYRAKIEEAIAAAHRGAYEVLIVWSLDRLTRGGAEDALRLLRRFREAGVHVVSVQESWLGVGGVADVLIAFAGWVAQQESSRRSERIKAGLARRKANGLPVGRAPGAKDRKPRRRSGYFRRWEEERQRAV
jgi:DNA invertase Pin-like site-specific DNA recombinase